MPVGPIYTVLLEETVDKHLFSNDVISLNGAKMVTAVGGGMVSFSRYSYSLYQLLMVYVI